MRLLLVYPCIIFPFHSSAVTIFLKCCASFLLDHTAVLGQVFLCFFLERFWSDAEGNEIFCVKTLDSSASHP